MYGTTKRDIDEGERNALGMADDYSAAGHALISDHQAEIPTATYL